MDRCDSSLPTVDYRKKGKETQRGRTGKQTDRQTEREREREKEKQFSGQHDDQVLKAADAIIIILP